LISSTNTDSLDRPLSRDITLWVYCNLNWRNRFVNNFVYILAVQRCFFLLLELWEVESILGPRGTAAMYWPIVPVPVDCEDGDFGGMCKGV
jgi:hypothetical protein